MRFISIIILLAVTIWSRPSFGATPAPARISGYGPLSPTSGWILAENRLFLTRDEGGSWHDITPQFEGDFLAAAFVDGGHGWLVAARHDGLSLARTSDFGASWHWLPLSLSSTGEPDPAISELLLDFDNPAEGTMVLRYAASSNFERWSEWRTADGGENWTMMRRSDDAAESVPTRPVVNAVFLPNGRDGWRLQQLGRCTLDGPNRICEQKTSLQVTHDGGETWGELQLPAGVGSPVRSVVAGAPPASAAATGGSRTTIAIGQGFDKCEIPALSELYEWRWASPYSVVNLYIGGSLRACPNWSLSAEYLQSLAGIGWSFIPTWVGPQAPCTTFRNRISYDTATAQTQGRTEANAAADALARLGLTAADGTGSIVYYDMEAYTSTAECNAAVRSFISGWTQALHARGHLSGVYGLGWTLGLFAGVPQPPDAIWAAHWIRSSYDSTATVWDVYKLGNDVWSNYQRLRQYTGGHSETWGSRSLTIDSNVLLGPVAVAGVSPDTPTPTPTAIATPTATPTRFPVPFTPRAWIYIPLLLQP